ncbi:hypothetical protein MTO96_007894 [Rhipicephalus appendiculatus]
MNPSTDEPSRKNASLSKKETPKAGTEDLVADQTEDVDDDAEECPITEQFFRSDVDDLLGTPNDTQPVEFPSFSEDFDTAESSRRSSAVPVDIDDIIQETNVTLSRIDTDAKKRRSASRKPGGTAQSARNQRLAFTSGMAEKKKGEGPSAASPLSPAGKQHPHAANRASAKDNEASGKASAETSPAPVATSTAVTRGPRLVAKPAPASSGRGPAADANLKEEPSGTNSLNLSPARSPRGMVPNQRTAHQTAHFQGPFSGVFSPDTTQSPPSLASAMSPAANVSAQGTSRRSSAATSHRRRDSNGSRRSFRRQSRDGDESFSTESGDSDDFYANSRHRRRSRSSHYRQRRRRSKDRGSRRRRSRDRRGSAHNERDPSVGPFNVHPYWNAPSSRGPAYYAGLSTSSGLPTCCSLPRGTCLPTGTSLPTRSTTGFSLSAACCPTKGLQHLPQLRFRIPSTDDLRNT